jgi:hypothetical protein
MRSGGIVRGGKNKELSHPVLPLGMEPECRERRKRKSGPAVAGEGTQLERSHPTPLLRFLGLANANPTIARAPAYVCSFAEPPLLHRIDAIHPLCKMAFNPSGCIQRVGSVAANGIRARDGLLRE